MSMRHQHFKMSRRWTTLLLVVGLCLTATAQMESRLTCRRYTTQDGLPQMQTERIWQDSRGYIYIGTLSGFVRFDGREFTPFLKGRRENIVGFTEADGVVRALGFRRQWLTGYDHVEMKPIDPEGRWLLNNFNAGSLPEGYVLLEDEREENRRLCEVTDDGFRPVLKGALLDLMTPDRELYIDSTGVYVPTERGLYRVTDGKRAIRLTAKEDFFTLLRTGEGLLAFAADGIYRIGARSISRMLTYTFAAPDYGLIVRRLANGHLAIADSHTIYEYDGHGMTAVASGFNIIKDMMADRWDRLWVATYEGAFCFFNRCFTTHRLTDENDIVRAIAVGSDGQLVMGTLNGKVLAGSQLISDEGGFFSPSAVTIADKVYLAGPTDVLQYDGKASWLGVSQERIQFVGKARGRLIIGGRHSISSYDPATGRLDTLTAAIAHPWCAEADGEGRLWVGSSYGLYSIPEGGEAVKTDHPQKLVVTTMTRDAVGNILFASADSIFLIRNGQVEAMTSQIPQLAGHEVRSLYVSPRGYLAIAVIDGLFLCRFSNDCRLSDIRYYDHTNGFTALEPQKAVMAETADGTIWLPGVEVMTSFQPEQLLDFRQEDTYIAPPPRWWQHWWVWLIALTILSLAVWRTTRIYEERKSRRAIRQLQGKKMEDERQIRVIRDKAIKAETSQLAKDIVKITEKAPSTRMTITTNKGTVMLDAIDIAYFKADGNYTRMVTFQGEDIIFQGLGRLEKTLDPSTFVRADRSTVVNIHNISRLDARERLCTFRSPDGAEVETTLLLPAFKRLKEIL